MENMDNMVNSKKSHKKHGMSLVEVIVSLAILAVMALVLTTIARSVDQYRMATKARNDKTALQGPVAECQKNRAASLINDNYEINVTANGSTVTIKGRLYDTNTGLEQAKDDDDNLITSNTDIGNEQVYVPDGKTNMKYIYIEDAHKHI